MPVAISPIELWYTRYWDEFTLVFYPKSYGPQNVIAEASHIASELIPIVSRHADWACIEALAKYVAHTSNIHPHDIETLTKSLSFLQTTPSVVALSIARPNEWPGPRKVPFKVAMTACLTEAIDEGLDDAYAPDEDAGAHDAIPESIGDLRIEPDNIRITTAFLSASAIKYGLQDTTSGENNGIAAIRVGLRDPVGSAMEVFVTVACIHLAVCGDILWKEGEELFGGVWEEGQSEIRKALHEVKNKDIVKTSGAANLLERTIQIVESKFSRMMLLSEGEAWEVLFLA